MFRHHQRPEPPWPTIETALGQAGEGYAGDLRRRGTVLPGIREALTVASEEPDWVSTVLTGNIAANARLKLSAFDLDQFLDLPVGSLRRRRRTASRSRCCCPLRIHRARGLADDVPVVLIGDTPRDVEAALTTGSAIIAVSTGIYSPAKLAAAHAPMVLPDLSDTGGPPRRPDVHRSRMKPFRDVFKTSRNAVTRSPTFSDDQVSGYWQLGGSI